MCHGLKFYVVAVLYRVTFFCAMCLTEEEPQRIFLLSDRGHGRQASKRQQGQKSAQVFSPRLDIIFLPCLRVLAAGHIRCNQPQQWCRQIKVKGIVEIRNSSAH